METVLLGDPLYDKFDYCVLGQNGIRLKGNKTKMKYRGSPTSTVSTSTISTSTNFQKVLHKVVLVGDLISKFVLVELTLCTTQLLSTNFA